MAVERCDYPVIAYLKAVFVGLDIFLCAILTGQTATTISLAAAYGQEKRILAGCVFCQFLNIIQPNHCESQLAGLPMSLWSYAKGLILISALAIFLHTTIVFTWFFLARWI